MATIKIFTNAFTAIIIPNVDISTFAYYGPTDGYSGKDRRDYSLIGFVVDDAKAIVDEVKKGFKLNPERCKPEDYIWVRDKFDEYKKDKRPRISIRLDNGIAGMANPPSFEIIADAESTPDLVGRENIDYTM